MSEANINVIQKIYAAFGSGDVPGIMELIDDGLTQFGVVSESSVAPWHVQASKKADVPQFFQALGGAVDFTLFEPHTFAAAGDHVYCSVSFDATVKKNGKKLSYRDTMHRFKLKAGRVVEWRGTEDTAKTNAGLE